MASLLSLRFVSSLEIHEALLGAARCDAAAMSALLDDVSPSLQYGSVQQAPGVVWLLGNAF